MIDTEQLKHDIGRRIKEARLSTDYTQEQIADMLDITAQSVSNLESGKYLPKLIRLMELCELLNVSCDYLLFGREQVDNEMPAIMHIYSNLAPEKRQFLDRVIFEFDKVTKSNP